MRMTLALLGLVSLLVLPALPAAASPPSTQAAAAKSDALKGATRACNLLTSKDIQSVQGEALKKATGRESVQGDLAESQCYFALATASKSISLSVTTAHRGKEAKEVKAFWDAGFHGKPVKKKLKAPTKIDGLGQEAFWVSSASGGNLYVFDRNRLFRISIGGPGDQALKLKRATTLARKVLARI